MTTGKSILINLKSHDKNVEKVLFVVSTPYTSVRHTLDKVSSIRHLCEEMDCIFDETLEDYLSVFFIQDSEKCWKIPADKLRDSSQLASARRYLRKISKLIF
jgi:hypothetical protein